jgi:hypothetical protein
VCECGDRGEVNAIEEALHVFDGINRHAHFAHFAEGQRVVGIESDLGWQIECHRETSRSVREQIFVAFVRLFGVAHACVLAHGPEAAAVHGGLHAAGVGKFSGVANVAVIIVILRGKIGRSVQRVYGDV